MREKQKPDQWMVKAARAIRSMMQREYGQGRIASSARVAVIIAENCSKDSSHPREIGR